MKQTLTLLLCMIAGFLIAGTTPMTVVMTDGVDNATAFSADGLVGNTGVDHYLHWDNTNLYIGWTGGSTIYSSDLYYMAIDVMDGQGSSGTIENVNFSDAVFDYYVVYENNSTFYGAPTTNGNAYEIYQDNGSNGWTFLSRTPGDNGTTSEVSFSGTNYVRVAIPWATLGVMPGADTPIAVSFWNNNNAGNFVFAGTPDNLNGNTPVTITNKLFYSSTAAGTNPSTDGAVVPLAAVLPVVMKNFSAAVQDNNIHLTWTTSTEQNNDYFAVQRSTNATDYQTIGRVAGNGTTEIEQQYRFVDERTPAGVSYYRLAQTDFDGTIHYSKILSVERRREVEVDVYPNPVSEVLYYQYPEVREAHRVFVRSAAGNIVLADRFREQGRLDVAELPNGLYFLEIVNRSGVAISTRRFVK